jgi:hypothetical protein
LPRPTEHDPAATDELPAFVTEALWPMVDAAFRDDDQRTDAFFARFDEFQVVISRAPARGNLSRTAERKVTLEIWPARGPRLLVVDWSGRCPHVVHWRDGDWLYRLPRASLQEVESAP